MVYKHYMVTGEIQDIVTKHPITVAKLQLLVGGHYEIVTWKDKMICFYKPSPFNKPSPYDPPYESNLTLPPNPHFPTFYGNLVVGRPSPHGKRFFGFEDTSSETA